MRADAQLPSQFRRLVGMAVADAIVMVFWNNSAMCFLSPLVIAMGHAINSSYATMLDRATLHCA